jgi:VIT1/CCC1 family predicted Fe2+/Mn2+ transporter
MTVIVVVILVLLLLGSFPAYPYNREWGYGPSGVIGLILLILLVVYLAGGLHHLR